MSTTNHTPSRGDLAGMILGAVVGLGLGSLSLSCAIMPSLHTQGDRILFEMLFLFGFFGLGGLATGVWLLILLLGYGYSTGMKPAQEEGQSDSVAPKLVVPEKRDSRGAAWIDQWRVMLWVMLPAQALWFAVWVAFLDIQLTMSMGLCWFFLCCASVVCFQAHHLLKSGQTPGMKAKHLKVVCLDGSDITESQAWVRSGVMLIFTCYYFINYLPMLFTKYRRCIHDLAAGTVLVKELSEDDLSPKTHSEDSKPVTSATEWADRTGVSKESIVEAIRSGQMKGFEQDGNWYVSRRPYTP